jgi:tRNA acetyltransferase TAN1
LNRSQVIDKVAKMISTRHKVELKNPDKVIIIEIFQVRRRSEPYPFLYHLLTLCSQTFCGMSVVGHDWEAMKRYNIHELYSMASKGGSGLGQPERPANLEDEKSKAETENKSAVRSTE